MYLMYSQCKYALQINTFCLFTLYLDTNVCRILKKQIRKEVVIRHKLSTLVFFFAKLLLSTTWVISRSFFLVNHPELCKGHTGFSSVDLQFRVSKSFVMIRHANFPSPSSDHGVVDCISTCAKDFTKTASFLRCLQGNKAPITMPNRKSLFKAFPLFCRLKFVDAGLGGVACI